MDVALPILLMIIGFGLIVLEVLIPSLGVITVAAVGCIVASLFLGFSYSPALGLGLIVGALLGIPIILVLAFKLFPETPLGRHMMLRRKPSDHPAPATVSGRTDLVGKEGVARSDLRPSGVAEVDGERLDVLTRGELVEVGARIRIIENRGNRIVVRAIDTETAVEEEDLR